MSDRIDDLLDRALATGSIPAEATPAERKELEGMLAAMRGVRETGLAIRAEAKEAMPTARARFERFRAEAQAAGRTAPAPGVPLRKGWLSRFLGGHGLSLAGVAAAVAAIAVGMVVAPGLFGGVESASAQVLVPGSYVQVEGVVDQNTARGETASLVVGSELGDIQVDLGDDTSVLEGETPRTPADVAAGRKVVISGVVGEDGRVRAQTVAVGEQSPPPQRPAVKRLKDLPGTFEGTIRAIAFIPGGRVARVHIESGDGGHFWAEVAMVSVERLLETGANVLGERVRLVHEAGQPRGVFVLEALAASGSDDAGSQAPTPGAPATRSAAGGETPAAGPELVTVLGVLVARDGAILQVQTRDRLVPVRVTLRTQILVGRSGLTPDAPLGEKAIGHLVSVIGGIDREAGLVVADLVAVGPLPGEATPPAERGGR